MKLDEFVRKLEELYDSHDLTSGVKVYCVDGSGNLFDVMELEHDPDADSIYISFEPSDG